jgi:hypothetical protein
LGKDIKDALQSGKYVLATTTLIAIIVTVAGVWQGYIFSYLAAGAPAFPKNILIFLENGFIYFMGAVMIYVLGKTLDTYLRTGMVLKSSLSIILSVFAVWFIYLAVNDILQYIAGLITNFDFPIILLYIALGGFFGFFSIEIYHYIKIHSTKGSAQKVV